jgi:hypothetical protein
MMKINDQNTGPGAYTDADAAVWLRQHEEASELLGSGPAPPDEAHAPSRPEVGAAVVVRTVSETSDVDGRDPELD